MEHQDKAVANWSRTGLLAFRFAFVYLVLYNLPSPLGALPHTGSLARKYQSLWHILVPWVAKHALHLSHEITISNMCSGDTLYDYVRVLCMLSLAVAASAVWSFLDRSRPNYQRLHQWLRLYVRLSLGVAMLLFGAGKIFRVQFPEPSLYKLLEPYGDSSPMSLLWTFMGTSRIYSVFAGCVQMLGGVLLFIPRLTTLAALIGIAVFSNIFVLNLSYDVPIKLYSLHLLLFCLFLVLADARRLINLFLLNGSVQPRHDLPLFNHRGLNTGILAAQLTFGIFLVCSGLYRSYKYEKEHFAISSRPAFYGIWMVDEFRVDGKILPPLFSDESRWDKIVFQFPNRVDIQSRSGAWTRYRLRTPAGKDALTVEVPDSPQKKLQLTFSGTDAQSLFIEGSDKGGDIRARLRRVDDKQFALLGRGFHWISEDADFVRDEEGVCDHALASVR